MHDKTNERYDRIVKQTFGPTAEYTGAMGSAIESGLAEIRVDGHTIGTGPTFEAALQDAQRTAAKEITAV